MIGALSRKVGEILGKACRMEDVTILKVATYRSVYIYIYVYICMYQSRQRIE